MRAFRAALALLTWVLGAIVCLPAFQERQTFRTTTRLVEVSAVVTDRAGRPVGGLTRDDFAIAEDGVPQAISIFQVSSQLSALSSQRSALSGQASAEASQDARHAGGHTLSAPSRTRAAGVFSNAAHDPSQTSVVILLDRLNAAFDSQWFARRHVDSYLSDMPGDCRVALYVLDGGMRVLHDFTDNVASLRSALDTYQARGTAAYDASNEPPTDLSGDETMSVWIVDPSTSVSEFFTRQRWRNTFGALQVLARHLSGIAGRKSIVWASEVFPIPAGPGRAEFLEEMRETTRALNDAQVALYPVDARGLVGAVTYSSGGPRFTSFGAIRGNIETMEIVAEETGGLAFANTNGLDVSMRRAVDDSRMTYLLGYYPIDASFDGRYRSIVVTMKKQGLLVRHRRGYAATSPAADRKSRDAALKEALQGPLAATQVGLAARAASDGSPSGLTLSIDIDPATLTLERGSGSWRGAVDVLVATVSRTGVATIAGTEHIEASIPETGSAVRTGVSVVMRVNRSRFLHQLRIVARDVASGRVGSLVVAAGDLPGTER